MIDRQDTYARTQGLENIVKARRVDEAGGDDPIATARDIIIATRQMYLERCTTFATPENSRDNSETILTWIEALSHDTLFPLLDAADPERQEKYRDSLFLFDRLSLLALVIATCPHARIVKYAANAAIKLETRERWIHRHSMMAGVMQHALTRCQHENVNAPAELERLLDERGSAASKAMGEVGEHDGMGWTNWEKLVVKHCREQADSPSDTFEMERARLLIDAIYSIFLTNHASTTRKLRKSGEISRVLHLLSSEELYPETPHKHTRWLHERLSLMFDIIKDSRQRPVLEKAALVALEQELEERWSRDFTDLPPRLRASMEHAEEKILPATALLGEFGEEVAKAQYDGLRDATFKNKRMRLVEMVKLLDTYAGSPGLKLIVSRSYEAIFDGLPAEQKGQLVDRLLRELEREELLQDKGTWTMILEPLLLQNKRNLALIERITELARQVPGIDVKRYESFYLEALFEAQDSSQYSLGVIEQIARSGGRQFIPKLYPLSEQTTGFFNRPTRVAEAAKEAIDAIIEREGLQDTGGSLTVAQGSGGELSLAMATEGALSVSDGGLSMGSSGGELTPTGATDASPQGSRGVAIGITLLVAILGGLGVLLSMLGAL